MNKFYFNLLLLLLGWGVMMTYSCQQLTAQNITCKWDDIHACPQSSYALTSCRVTNLNGITAIAMKITYDITVMNFTGPTQIHPSLFAHGVVEFSQSIPGHISFDWSSLMPVDFGDAKLFSFEFDYNATLTHIGFDTSQPGNCTFLGTPIPPNNPPVLPVQFISGQIDTAHLHITITSQPKDTMICAGIQAGFSVEYQNANYFNWHCSTDGGNNWFNIYDGANYSGTFSPDLKILHFNDTMHGYQYRCFTTNNCYYTFSNAASLLLAPPLDIHASPDTINTGGPALSASVAILSGTSPYTYQWNNGITAPSFTLPLNHNGSPIVTVTDGAGCVKTDTVVVQITGGCGVSAPIDTVCPGTIAIPVVIQNLDSAASISLSLAYNDSILSYTTYQYLNPVLNQGTVIVNAFNGKLHFAWYSLNPVSISDETLIEFVFHGITGNSPLTWDLSTQGACQFTNLEMNSIPGTFSHGGIVIGGCGSISGTLTYDNDLASAISNVQVSLIDDTSNNQQLTTDNQGSFTMTGIMNGDYILHAQTTKPWGGANSVDALTVMKYFTGLAPLTGMKLLAADVNGSGNVNTLDASQIARRFVNQINSFPAGDWLFTTDSVNVNNDTAIVNLKGICVGDINGSYSPMAKDGDIPSLERRGSLGHSGDGLIDIPIIMDQDVVIASVSLVMQVLSDKLHIVSVQMNADGRLVYHLDKNQLRLAWYSLTPWSLKAGETLFVLCCENKKNQQTLQPAFELESGTLISDFDGNAIPGLAMIYPEIIFNQGCASLWQNIPNPFSGSTKIIFYIPNSGHVKISIIDLPGREIMTLLNEEVSTGNHEVILNSASLKPGIYLYRMECLINGEKQRITKRMVIDK